MKWTVEALKEFEERVIRGFEAGLYKCPVHLSGGNERELIDIFKSIKKSDYVFATHRNHYHYLLKGGSPEELLLEMSGSEDAINKGQARSMNICDPSINFYATAIVGGGCAIAVGVALALKKKKSKAKVYCFCGDGAEDSGHFVEAVRFGLSRNLPLVFILEDNDYSTDSTKEDRWHGYQLISSRNIYRYRYTRIYPHVGIGKHVTF